MKTTTEQLDACQVALNVEMEKMETDKYLASALKRLAERVTLPGFRKGKAPLTLIEQHISREAVMQEALEQLIPEAYQEALKTESVLAIAEPKIELLTIEPLTFKAIVPTKPVVEPGKYRDIKLEIEKKEIDEAEVDKVIEQLQLQFGSLEPVERPVRYGDVISADIDANEGAKQVLSRKDAMYEVSQDAKYPMPGFAEKLVDHKKDDVVEFTLSFPDDYDIKDIAGKEYSFKVNIKEVKEKKLPAIDDELAKNAGCDDLVKLKEQIRTGLQQRSDETARKEFENKLIKMLIEQSSIQYPPVLVDKEIEHLINEEARNFADGVKGLENFLTNTKRTMEQHREDLKPVAEERVKAYLLVGKIAELENITMTEDELNAAIEEMAKGDEQRQENIKNFFTLPQSRESLRDMLVINKAMDFLTKLVTGQAT